MISVAPGAGVEAAVHLDADVDVVLVEEAPLGVRPPLAVLHLPAQDDVAARDAHHVGLTRLRDLAQPPTQRRQHDLVRVEDHDPVMRRETDRHLADDLDVAGGLHLHDAGAAAAGDVRRAVRGLLVHHEHLVAP